MNSQPYIIAAYALTLIVTLVLLVSSYRSMRRAERAADDLRR